MQEELRESFLPAQMAEAAPARRAFLEIKGRDRVARFVSDGQQTGLHGMDDRLVNGHDVEIDQAAGKLEGVAAGTHQLARLEEAAGNLLGEKKEERRHL